MEHFFGEFAERFAVEVTVKSLDFGVFVARAAGHLLVALVEARNAGFAEHVGFVAEGGRLAAAGDAAARAGHHFDEVIELVRFACVETADELARIGGAVDDGNVDVVAGDRDGRLLHVLHAAHGGEVIELGRSLFAGQMAVGGAKRSLHDAAGIAEDGAGARAFAHQAVVLAVGQIGEADALGLGPVGELDGR